MPKASKSCYAEATPSLCPRGGAALARERVGAAVEKTLSSSGVKPITVLVNLVGEQPIPNLMPIANEVALVECKIGPHGLKAAIDHLNTAGGRDYLGTYTRKVIVSTVSWKANTNLSALAQARRINVIELLDYRPMDLTLSDVTSDHLRKEVERLLGKKQQA